MPISHLKILLAIHLPKVKRKNIRILKLLMEFPKLIGKNYSKPVKLLPAIPQ